MKKLIKFLLKIFFLLNTKVTIIFKFFILNKKCRVIIALLVRQQEFYKIFLVIALLINILIHLNKFVLIAQAHVRHAMVLTQIIACHVKET